MRTVRSVGDLRDVLAPERRAGHSIGLVPTMGSFHDGHLSLIRRAREQCDAVVVSLPPDDASFGFDYPRIRELLARRALAHTVVSGDPAAGTTAADRERIRTMLRAVSSREPRRG